MKKALGMILVLVMLVSMVPALEVAAAEETTWTKVNSLADIGANDTFAITITIGSNTYVLPVVQSGNNSQSQAIPEITATVDGNTLTITNTEYSFGWNLIPTDGGYHIKSADGNNYYLYVRASNNGINIHATAPKEETKGAYLWNILSCGLLGANSGSKYHTLSIDTSKDGWWTPGTTDSTATGTAYSSARNNVLGLWVLNASCNCEDVNPKDHKCDLCGTEMSTCTDAPTDGDHKCDICGAENLTQHADADNNKRCDDCNAAMCEGAHTDENPKDHVCDVCEAPTSTCLDEDPKDHNCDICGAPLSECQDAADDGDHNCDICNKEGVTDHKWQDATIEAPKTCTECGETEGEKLPLSPTPENSHWVKVEDLSEIAEGEKLAIAITIDGVTYLLPNAKVTNSVSAPTTEHKATISEDGRFLTVGSGRHNYNWTVVPAAGGYHIMSGGMYLWVDNGNAGVRISTDTPAVWKIFSGSKLLGSQDPSGNLRTLCIREGIWQSFKVSSETAQAHSTVRNNTLSLWKYVSGPDDAASQTGDSTVSVMFATLVISAMSVVALVSKKKF